jgi:5'-phosphate synthase pdxT subunit
MNELPTKVQSSSAKRLCIGVLAIQGAFIEHITMLHGVTLDLKGRNANLVVKAIRTTSDLNKLEDIDGLVIPGGESTVMALVAERLGLWSILKAWVQAKKPTWGTCAGIILLAQSASHTKEGGQELLKGISIHIDRNYYGSQTDSFTWPLNMRITPEQGHKDISNSFIGVFIRAPMIDSLLVSDKDANASSRLQILATLPKEARPDKNWTKEPIVAIREEFFLGTTFHPELTNNTLWHEYFITMVYDYLEARVL